MSRSRHTPARDPDHIRLRPDGGYARDNGDAVWVIVGEATRAIVWGRDPDDAWNNYIVMRFRNRAGQAPLVEPLRSECKIRLADLDEASRLGKRGSRRGRPTQSESMFDADRFSKAGDHVTALPGPDPLLNARLAIARANARTSDPLTSHQAAAGVQPKLRANQNAVLRVLGSLLNQEGTDEEIQKRYDALRVPWDLPKQAPSGLRTRRRELVDIGLVRPTPDRRKMSTGGMAIVWEIAPV